MRIWDCMVVVRREEFVLCIQFAEKLEPGSLTKIEKIQVVGQSPLYYVYTCFSRQEDAQKMFVWDTRNT